GDQKVGLRFFSSTKRTFQIFFCHTTSIFHVWPPSKTKITDLVGPKASWVKNLAFLGPVPFQDLVDHSVFLGLPGLHPEIPVAVRVHLVQGLSGMLGDDLIEFILELEHLLGGDL